MTQPDGRRKRSTLASVASAAGVSLATVSKVVNGRDDVAPDTRAEVERLLEEHEYVRSAKRRVPSGSRTIALVFDDFMSPYATELIRGVTDAGVESEVDVVVGRFSIDRAGPSSGAGWAQRLVRDGRDGVLIVTSDLTLQQLAAFERARLPLVVIDPVHLPRADVTSIGATNWSGSLSATEHLIGLGHRRIAFVRGPDGAMVGQTRLHGYRAAMTNAGLTPEPDLVVAGDFGFEAGLAAGRRLLSMPEPPTAVVAVTDVAAFGVLQAAHAAGLRVPEDLSVVGFDDTYMAAWSCPPLTTVHAPLQEMGRVALRTLLRIVDGGTVDSHHVELATELVVRASTGPPRQNRATPG
jgi:LacI family transcriptional regulator